MSKTRAHAIDAVEAKASDKRFAPRRKGQTPALVYLNGGSGSFPCLIRDTSSTGARLELQAGWDNPFSAGVSLNDRVTLVVRMDRVVYECKIVRRSETELGVKFVAAPKPLAKVVR
ncbi:MAG: PilZ domain-containing protein [Hyphomicrobium sp.]